MTKFAPLMSVKITIIGTGNVAWHLAPELERTGHVINEIYGRSEEKALQISKNLYNPTLTESLDFSLSTSSLFIIAVSDNAIKSIASEIVLPDEAMVVHTSGSVTLSTLELTALDRIGVFYPLQTFSKERKMKFSEVPILVESNDQSGEEELMAIASSISSNVTVANSEDRLGIHLAAVFANNFTNHMIDIASQLMDNSDLDLELLRPLIRETIEKALDQNPSEAQTGPAIREDTETMQKHLEQLGFNPRYQELYNLISESIREGK